MSIIANGLARDLPDHVATELINRVNGLPRLAAVDDLALAFTKARNGGARYQPSEDEQEILFRILDLWTTKSASGDSPGPRRRCANALFDEIGDRAH